MSTHQELPPALAAELEYYKTLPQDDEGPIADTYERLHGINFLRAAAPRDLTDAPARVYVALMQCRELAFFNMAALVRDCSQWISSRRPDGLDAVSHNLRWAYSIARHSYDVSSAATGLADKASAATDGSGASAAQNELEAALREFSDGAMAYLSVNEDATAASIERKYLLDGSSVFVHTTKNIGQLVDSLFSLQLAAVREPILNSYILRAGVHALNTRSASYMMQFRLFHQIPEVLSFEAGKLMTSATAHLRGRRIADAAADLRLANVCLEHIVSSLHPLIELLQPSEYYKFRAHLGQTSGGHSNDLAKTVLRQAYLSLAETFVSLQLPPSAPHDSIERALGDEMNRVRQQISKWRGLHIMLPRNVLGTEATSLIGSRNAEQIVQDMKASFEARDALRQPKNGKSSGERPQAANPLAVDHKLRVMTGTVTKRKFPDVEKREGTFSPKR